MRRSLTIVLIAALAALPWFLYKPKAPDVARADQPAQHLSTYHLTHDADWFGGFSGIELTKDGHAFYLASDRGQLLRGTIDRQNTTITNVIIQQDRPLTDHLGQVPEFPHTDAEGLALDTQNRLNVSFEHAHRVLRYDTFTSDAIWPGYTRAWRALPQNNGMEMLAIDPNGTLFAIPEAAPKGAYEALVYRRLPHKPWDQPFTYPLDLPFRPVGGDFGPDGRLYVLERHVHLPFFRSQVRVMDVTPTGFANIETVLATPLGTHGNVEGLAVWADTNGKTRLTMVSDDNFMPFLRTDIIEYILTD